MFLMLRRKKNENCKQSMSIIYRTLMYTHPQVDVLHKGGQISVDEGMVDLL
jgi:hypothetical protein